jgi:hypothetical protein
MMQSLNADRHWTKLAETEQFLTHYVNEIGRSDRQAFL